MKRKARCMVVGMTLLAFVVGFGIVTAENSYAADKVIKWRVQSHWPASSSSYKASLQVLADRIKERTNGRLILEPFAAGSLVPAKEIFNAVKRGMIQMGTISPAYVRDQIEVAGIAAGLPYAFKMSGKPPITTNGWALKKLSRPKRPNTAYSIPRIKSIQLNWC